MRMELFSFNIRNLMISVLCFLLIVMSLGLLAPITVDASGANLIAGRSYTTTMSANTSYSDSMGIELTDGVTASPLLADTAWQGRFNPGTYSFTVDLGSSKSIETFEAGFFKYSGAAIQLPTEVSFTYSSDNLTFSTACSVNEQVIGSDIVRVPYQCSLSTPITARYVRMTVTNAASTWSFIDEWRVLEADPVSSPTVKLNGSFLQPELGEQWSNTEWNNEFQYMQNLGMDHLILQWSANTEFGTAVYPTTIASLTQHTTQDVVAKALEMGEQYDIDIYIGLQLNHEWFANYTSNLAWLDEEAGIAGDLIEDLWDQYGSYNSLKGWYLSFEVDNWNMPNSTAWQRMADFYNDVTAVADTVTPDLPIMISPFYNVSGGLTPSEWETMWNYILSRTDIDIIALQDGIGAGHAVTSDLANWFATTKNAINTSSPATELWADMETFNLDFNPMDVKHMLDNMAAVAPYVSQYTSFSFNHYMSPQTVNPLYYETYGDYLATGIVDSAAPTTATALTATAANSMTVNLSWTASTDNTGVVGYQIYRNGEIVHATYTAATSFTDNQLIPLTPYTYSVKAFDAAGNLSPYSSTVSVTTQAGSSYPNIWSAGKSYTSSMTADVLYSDLGGTELTDGASGTATYVDGAWQGRNTSNPYSFIVDLGSLKTVGEVNANFLQVKSVYVLLPKDVRFSVSTDNVNFTNIGTVEKPAVSSTDQTKKYRLTDLSSISARYVKVEIVPSSSAWTFIDEIQVKN